MKFDRAFCTASENIKHFGDFLQKNQKVKERHKRSTFYAATTSINYSKLFIKKKISSQFFIGKTMKWRDHATKKIFNLFLKKRNQKKNKKEQKREQKQDKQDK